MDISINIGNNQKLKTFKINLILLSILLIAFILRIYKLDFQGAWLDELHTLKEADPNLTLKEFHEMIMWREGIPHFYFLIVRFFGEIFGHGLFSIRLVSCVCGVLAVYGMYLLGKSLVNKQTGYIAAALLAIHPIHIEYSQEGRSYVMITMFLIFSVYRLSLFLKNVNLKNAIYLGVFTGLITNAQPIAIVCVLSIYLILGLFFLMIKNNAERINFIKYTFISGITTLIVFYPVYQIVEKVSKATSFWVQKPNYDYTVYILEQLAGGNKALLIISLLSYIILIVFFIKSLKQKQALKENQQLINFTIVFIWVFFYFLFILIKSFGNTSLMLIRYIIPLTPGFVLTIALAISNFKNKILKISLTAIVSFILMYSLFYEKDYYNKRQKAQFNDLSEEVISLNVNNDAIVSNWGWLLSYYFQKDNPNKIVLEKDLENYTQDMLKGNTNSLSFWYIDGNSRPYTLGGESEKFLKENFIVTNEIKMHDAWAIHYKSKNPNNLFIELPNFKPALFDGTGAMIFVENSKSTYPALDVEEGNYVFSFKGISLPEKPIKGENAHFNVFINDQKIGEFNLSNLPDQKPIDLNYQHKGGKLILKLEYDNDIVVGNDDRNAILNAITIKKNK